MPEYLAMSGTHIERCEIVGEVAGANFSDGGLDSFLKHFRDLGGLRTVVSLTTGEFTTGQIAEQLLQGSGLKNQISAIARVVQIVFNINQHAENLGVPPIVIKDLNKFSPLSLNPEAAAAFMALRERILPVEIGGNPRLFMTESSKQIYEGLANDLLVEGALEQERRAKSEKLIVDANDLLANGTEFSEGCSLSDIARLDNIADVVEALGRLDLSHAIGPIVEITKKRLIRQLGFELSVAPLNKLSESFFGDSIASHVRMKIDSYYVFDIEKLEMLRLRVQERFDLAKDPAITEADLGDYYEQVERINDYVRMKSSTVPSPGNLRLQSAILAYASLCRLPKYEIREVELRCTQLRNLYYLYLISWGFMPNEISRKARLELFKNTIGTLYRPEGANCNGVDPELFYPERGESTREAKEVCKGCKIRPDCLENSLEKKEKFGIWGGLSERERRRLRRKRREEISSAKIAVAAEVEVASAGD